MAEGLSNSAIAERLVVTERAVEKHVTSIFGKLRLGADSDTTAACSPCSRSCAPSRSPRSRDRTGSSARRRLARLGSSV